MSISDVKTPNPDLTMTNQAYGDDPLADRHTDQYRMEYVMSFVEKWDELIDWSARAESEGRFFIDILRARGKQSVLDVACGTGFHSVRLMQAGFDVTAADGSAAMLAKAFENGRERGLILNTVQADWRWLNREIHGKYDAIICLGNSFTHLHDEADRRRALAEFYAALKHDGILIIDQRNYDMILDRGFSTRHKYYYCGDRVTAEPVHMDDTLARFRYSFPDGSEYTLNMCPIRKNYLRRLLKEAGFQRVRSYGDFQETTPGEAPDFFIHIAEKSALSLARDPAGRDEARTELDTGTGNDHAPEHAAAPGGTARAHAATASISAPETPEKTKSETASAAARPDGARRKKAADTAQNYYDSKSADLFYSHIWGGEDVHIGLYDDTSDIREASRRTVDHMIGMLAGLEPHMKVIDFGAGYGGAMRALVHAGGCRATCLNISGVQNDTNRLRNAKAGLDDRIKVLHGSFEDVPCDDAGFDVVWSQDSILHAGDRERVFAEAARVLRPGGTMLFTDPMQADDADPDMLGAVYDRLGLSDLGAPGLYREFARANGLEFVSWADRTDSLRTHYARIGEALTQAEDTLVEKGAEPGYIAAMKKGLAAWVEAADRGQLCWGFMQFRKRN